MRRALELRREAEAGGGAVEGAPRRRIARIQDAVQERDVRGIDTALERLQPVAALPELRHEALRVGRDRDRPPDPRQGSARAWAGRRPPAPRTARPGSSTAA